MQIGSKVSAGREDEFPLEHRILNIMLAFGVIMSSMGTIINIFLKLGAAL